MRPVLLALLAALTLAGQEPTDGRVALTVKDSAGAPIAGALILLNGSTTDEKPEQVMRNGRSDAAGAVRFAGLPNGYYRVEAHVAGRVVDPRDQLQLHLEGPQANVSSEVRLLRRPVVMGRVLNELGVPVFQATVSLKRRKLQNGQASIEQAAYARTDDRGVFRIATEPGRYWLQASATEASFPRGSAPLPTGVVFYPGSPDLLGAQPLELAWDQPQTYIEIALPRAPRTQMTAAIVSGPSGQPCNSCGFRLLRVEGDYRYEIVGGMTGSRPGFDYRGIPAGDYRIHVEDVRRNRGWWAIAETTLVEGTPTELLIETRPPAPLSGRVVLEDPPANLAELNREREDAISVVAQGGRQGFFTGGSFKPRVSLPLDQLHFSLGPFTPEQYTLQVDVQGANAYIAGIRRRGRPLPAGLLDFSRPGSWTDLEVRVRFDPAVARFRIPAPVPLDLDQPAARVALVPDRESGIVGRPQEAHCYPGGECSAPPVPPGRYWVIAMPGINNPAGLDLRDAEVQSRLSLWGRAVDLAPGENPVIELEAVPEGALDP